MFLADAGDEGLTWEVKASQLHADSIPKAVCGLATSVGGYLILGASPAADASCNVTPRALDDPPVSCAGLCRRSTACGNGKGAPIVITRRAAVSPAPLSATS